MLNLKVYKKKPKTWPLYFETEEGSTIDLTGCTIYFTVKTKKTDTDLTALIAKTITVHTEATAGISAITLTAANTDLAIGTYYAGLEYLDSSAVLRPIGEGLFTVSRPTRIG